MSTTITACSVCGGMGTPVSGRPCICGGRGSQDAELDGFRQLCYSQDREIEELKAFITLLRGTGGRLANFRDHSQGCEIENTDFCTCGLRQAADAWRAAYAASKKASS